MSACGTEMPAPDGDPGDPYAAPIAGIRDGHIKGQVGDQSVDAATSPLDYFDGEREISIVAVVEIEEHAVMLQLTLTHDEDLLVPGVDEHVKLYDARRIRLLGCVGQGVGTYDEYESPADDITLVVDDAPDGEAGDVLVTVIGTWNRPHADPPSDPRIAHTRFILER